MPSARFARYVLRTTELPAAARFYDAVLGPRALELTALPPAALARGARPHWLGHVAVPDVGAAASAFVDAGAQRLGEPAPGMVALREPGGALLALSAEPAPVTSAVAWHVYRAPTAEQHFSRFAAVFGWALGPAVDVAGHALRSFAWDAGGAPVGVVGELTPGVHPQWLFFFAVPSVESAAAAVRAAGGLALAPTSASDGRRFCACDDPQGAAFGLLEA